MFGFIIIVEFIFLIHYTCWHYVSFPTIWSSEQTNMIYDLVPQNKQKPSSPKRKRLKHLFCGIFLPLIFRAELPDRSAQNAVEPRALNSMLKYDLVPPNEWGVSSLERKRLKHLFGGTILTLIFGAELPYRLAIK